ncbi:hypothetical protein Tco_0245780 [Tanacetum coccineum]
MDHECFNLQNDEFEEELKAQRIKNQEFLDTFKEFCDSVIKKQREESERTAKEEKRPRREMQRIPEESVSSLKMGDEHLNTQKDSRESSVKYPIPTPRELDVIPDEYYDEDYQKRFDELVKDFLSPTSIYDNISIGIIREQLELRIYFQNEFNNEKNSNSETIADLPIKDSFLMVDEQINTTPSTESDEIKKSSVRFFILFPEWSNDAKECGFL